MTSLLEKKIYTSNHTIFIFIKLARIIRRAALKNRSPSKRANNNLFLSRRPAKIFAPNSYTRSTVYVSSGDQKKKNSQTPSRSQIIDVRKHERASSEKLSFVISRKRVRLAIITWRRLNSSRGIYNGKP